MNYYNDNDKHAASWLKQLIVDGLIPPGDVDERSIFDVKGSDQDLLGYSASYQEGHGMLGIEPKLFQATLNYEPIAIVRSVRDLVCELNPKPYFPRRIHNTSEPQDYFYGNDLNLNLGAVSPLYVDDKGILSLGSFYAIHELFELHELCGNRLSMFFCGLLLLWHKILSRIRYNTGAYLCPSVVIATGMQHRIFENSIFLVFLLRKALFLFRNFYIYLFPYKNNTQGHLLCQ